MFDQLRLRTKMICGFTLIALIAGAVGGIGIRGMHHLVGNLVELTRSDVVFSNLADDALYHILQHRRHEKDVFLNITDPARKALYLAEYEQSAALLRTTINSLRGVAAANPRLGAATKDLVAALPGKHGEYVAGFYSVMARIDADPRITPAKANALMEPFKQRVYALESDIQSIKRLGDQMADNVASGSIRESKEERLLLSVVVATGFLLALALGVLVARRIALPLSLIGSAANELRQGNCDVTIAFRSGDELGGLAETFRQMVEAQQRKVEMAQQVAAGNLDAPLELASERDTLGRALQSMTGDLKRHIAQLQETTAAKERIQSELKVATDIQASLLPRIFPPFPDRPEVDIFAVMDPAKEVGGDFYDFFFVDESRLCFLIADVSDKGVPAALYMMVAKTLLKTEALRGIPPDQVLTRVNDLLAPDNDSCMFVTVFCALLDTATGELTIANAGHNPPLICTAEKGVEFMDLPPGFVLGPMAGMKYEARTLFLRPYDMVLLYTDGITEAKNREAAMFGEERLLDAFAGRTGESTAAIVHAIREEVRSFAEETPQSDDITMVALRFAGACPVPGKRSA